MSCTVCGAPTDLYLCRTHLNAVRDMLTGLTTGIPHNNGHRGAGYLAWLQDAANNHTRLGQSTRHSTEKGSPMLPRIGPHGGTGRKTVAESFTGSPSDLLDNVANFLAAWILDICDTHGWNITPTPPSSHTDRRNDPGAPWIDPTRFSTPHGDPGPHCPHCNTYHRGDCA